MLTQEKGYTECNNGSKKKKIALQRQKCTEQLDNALR